MPWLYLSLGISALFGCLGIQRRRIVQKSFDWLENSRPPIDHDSCTPPKIWLIIPLLREQIRLPYLFRHLRGLEYPPERLHIAFVTTAREDKDKETCAKRLPELANALARSCTLNYVMTHYLGVFPSSMLIRIWEIHNNSPDRRSLTTKLQRIYWGYPTTARLVNRWIKRLQENSCRIKFHHFHYQSNVTSMALQVNYGVDRLSGLLEVDQSECYVGIYNGDSFPPSESLRNLAQEASRVRKKIEILPPVFQQDAHFLTNTAHFPETLWGDLLRAGGVYQTNYALGRELPNHIRSYETLMDEGRAITGFRRPYTPVIGHGMFIRLDVFLSHQGLPTDFWCEDMALTYYYHLAGVPVLPVPALENNSTPLTIRSYHAQSGMWYTTAMNVTRLLRGAMDRCPNAPLGAKVGIFFRHMWRNIEWGFGPLIGFVLALIGFSHSAWLGIVNFLLFLGYIVLPQDVIWTNMSFRMYSTPSHTSRRWRNSVASVLFFFFVSSVGPIQSVYKRIIRQNINFHIDKVKTER